VEPGCDKTRPLCVESLLTEKAQLRVENDGGSHTAFVGARIGVTTSVMIHFE